MVEISKNLTASAVLQGIVIGVLVALLFVLVLLLVIRHGKPLLLLRQGNNVGGPGFGSLRLAVTTALGVALVGVVSSTA